MSNHGGRPWEAALSGARMQKSDQSITLNQIKLGSTNERDHMELLHWPQKQGGIRRAGTTEAVRQAVGGGRQSGWGRLLSVTNAVDAGTGRQADRGWAYAGRPGGGGG